MTASRHLAMALLALGLWGCADTATTPAVAGGEDFPNTVSVFGVSVQEGLDSSGSWQSLDSLPLGLPSTDVDDALPATARVAVPASPLAAGRAAASDSTLRLDLSDTADGIALLYTTKTTDSLFQADTLAIVWNAFAKDAVTGNEQIRWARTGKLERGTGRWMRQVIEPAGTDTMVTPLAGKANRIHLNQVTGWGARRSVLDLECDPGPDNSYDTESDSRIFWSRVVQLRGADTLESVTWRDGDGDSIATDRASGKKGVVTSVRVLPSPAGHPLVLRYEEEGRLRVDPRDSTATEPLRLRRLATWRSGRTVEETLGRAEGDSDLVAGDSAQFRRLAVFGADTVQVRFVMRMGANLQQDTGKQMLSMAVRVRKPTGRVLELTFTPDLPLRDNDPTRTGAVRLVEALPGGLTWVLEGRLLAGALTAHVSNGKDLSGIGTWDAAGNLLAWKPD